MLNAFARPTRSRVWWHAALLLFTLAGLLWLTGCSALPSLEGREESVAISAAQAETTRIGRAVSSLAKEHPGASGVHLLADPQEAFAVRALLIETAQRTLDIQYYIWRDDLTGTLLLDSLRRAADRGVRVRFLLDDSANGGLDDILAALASHPNISVRLFNPLAIRSARWINYIVDFKRINRRMHNKSFTADNQATIIGGRNVGDEYFGATQEVLFSDLDVLAVGPIVYDVSADFDRYWNSTSAYPAQRLLAQAPGDALQHLAKSAESISQQEHAQQFVQAIRHSDLIERLVHGNIELEWATVHMLSDDPRKALGPLPADQTVMHDLTEIFGQPHSHMDLVSSYFVPTQAGVDHLSALARRGIRIRILTNSLAATDVTAVHAGYAKRRKPMLQAGIQLYEMRPHNGQAEATPQQSSRKPRGSGPFRGLGLRSFGSSGSSLHAKTLSIDDERIFVGSFNFDPRSARLNTELGFVIDSPRFARGLHQAFYEWVPDMAYEVQLDDDDHLVWIESTPDGTLRYWSEPHASFLRRAWVGFLSLLPIEWML